MPGAQIEARGLSKSFQAPVLEDVSFQVRPGRSLALVGPSGCGKTTILHILAGLISGDSGQVELSPKEAGRSLVMQDHGLFPWKNAARNLELPLILAGLAPGERKGRVAAMLQSMGLAGLERRYPSQMSGGQRQRLALGRALIGRPDLLILDEPFSAIDAITRETLQELLASLWKDLGLTIVLATHSIDEAIFLGDQVLVLGGRPTRILSSLDNPVAGLDRDQNLPAIMELAARVRQALARA
jgi:NitT/TauT family transport system ATP-binding protein